MRIVRENERACSDVSRKRRRNGSTSADLAENVAHLKFVLAVMIGSC
jgi:hypothetical protein